MKTLQVHKYSSEINPADYPAFVALWRKAYKYASLTRKYVKYNRKYHSTNKPENVTRWEAEQAKIYQQLDAIEPIIILGSKVDMGYGESPVEHFSEATLSNPWTYENKWYTRHLLDMRAKAKAAYKLSEVSV